MEKRNVTRRCEIRAAQGEEFVLAGRALSYNEISSNELAPGIREKIMPGCFRASLAAKPVVALLNHNMTALPLGRTENGTLMIQDTDSALNFRVQLDKDNSQHRDVYAAVKRGDIGECSFQFICQDEDFTDARYNGQPCVVRCVKQAELIDVSVVTQPFYGDNATAVAARAQAATRAVEADADKARREKVAMLGKVIEKDMRGMAATEVSGTSDMVSSRLDDALKQYGYRLVDCGDLYCYAVPDSYDGDAEEENSCRFPYQLDDEGHVILGYADREMCAGWFKCAPHAARARYYQILPERRALAAEKDLQHRMQSAAGIFIK